MINPSSGNRLLTPPFSLSFLYTIQESGPSERAVRFPFSPLPRGGGCSPGPRPKGRKNHPPARQVDKFHPRQSAHAHRASTLLPSRASARVSPRLQYESPV